MALSVVERGEICVAAASEVLQDIANGRGKYAQAKLKSLEKDAVELAIHAEMLAKRLEAMDNLYQERDEELLRKSGELGRQEEELKAQKNLVVSDLVGQKQVLQDKESKLSSTKGNLKVAEHQLVEAIEEKKTSIKDGASFGAKLGALTLGVWTLGIGAPIGAAIGAATGAILNFVYHSNEEDNARSIRDRRRQDFNNVKLAIKYTETEICSLKSRMRSLASDIERFNQQRKYLHRKRSEIKTAILILKESIEFWKLYRGLSKVGETLTTSLQTIVARANKEQLIGFKTLHSRGTQLKKSTFFEAWADIEKMAAKSVDHVFIVDYSCVRY